MGDISNPIPLPPGWDCKYDPRTSRYYFVNYYTKTTTWDDPRLRHQQFQSQNTPLNRVTGIGESSPVQEINRTGSSVNRYNVRNSQVDTSVSTSNEDTEQLVQKIGSMFPTVTETHIRLLLKKYYNREAVVMSALQVEKHPITTPGPYSTPPPPIKHFTPNIPRGGSPIPRPGSGGSGSFIGSPRIGDAFRNSPRPHPSPKMKLRYMKSIFPSVEETVLLDVLSSNENNVQKASEALLEMGYEKKEIKPPKLQEQRATEQKTEQESPKITEPATVKVKTQEEKTKIKEKLQADYPNLPEQIINLALDSVNYNIDRANQILQIMVQEDNKLRASNSEEEKEEVTEEVTTDDKQTTDESDIVPDVKISEPLPTTKEETTHTTNITTTEKNKNKFWRYKIKNCNAKISREISIEKDTEEYKSNCLLQPLGPNVELQRGPNDDLLLPDYTVWNGANPNLVNGRNLSNAKGPNKALILTNRYQAKGPNPDIRKGPVFGLAKGSMYSQIKSVLNETRTK